ncbi:hypothetical protein V9L05_08645 [Bernardetia sp. Wsw4-3y2]|uniref:hypothetical protein n=1 Tax=Bernardetia sp. Wsw4-3y2 TaxID=3127471 RepID=UPI0030D33B93
MSILNKKKKKPTKTKQAITENTLDELLQTQLQYLTEEDAKVFIKMLNSNVARERALQELHKNQYLFI